MCPEATAGLVFIYFILSIINLPVVFAGWDASRKLGLNDTEEFALGCLLFIIGPFGTLVILIFFITKVYPKLFKKIWQYLTSQQGN